MTYEEIKSNCIKKEPSTKVWFEQIDEAINAYNNDKEGVNKAFSGVIRGMYAICSNNQLVYENDEKLGITHDDKIQMGDLFYKWEWINENFATNFDYELDEITQENILAIEQPKIQEIIEEILNARTEEIERMEQLGDSMWDSSNKNGMIGMFEDRGTVISTPNKKEIAKEIYINQGLKALAEEKGLDIYIPSCIGE